MKPQVLCRLDGMEDPGKSKNVSKEAKAQPAARVCEARLTKPSARWPTVNHLGRPATDRLPGERSGPLVTIVWTGCFRRLFQTLAFGHGACLRGRLPIWFLFVPRKTPSNPPGIRMPSSSPVGQSNQSDRDLFLRVRQSLRETRCAALQRIRYRVVDGIVELSGDVRPSISSRSPRRLC
jgi:hypothetical protein